MNDKSMKSTPLYDLHKSLNAKLVQFAGYQLPIQYPDGIIKETFHTRENASLFDIGHMGQINIDESAVDQLAKIVPADIKSLNNYQHVYSFLLNEQGGILDDLIIAKRDQHFYVVVNGAVKSEDLAHIKNHVDNQAIKVIDDEYTLIAIQGPKARQILSSYNADIANLSFLHGGWFELNNIKCYVSCSGYTGEDGFELSLPIHSAHQLVEDFLSHELLKPAGLGSRDILRLEAGLCLYGNDLTTQTSPVEASLKWAIPKSRRHGDESSSYIGSNIIDQQFNEAPEKKRVGFIAEGKVPLRAGTVIIDENDNEVGSVTSGAFSPHIQAPIAMGYIQHKFKIDDKLIALVRDKKISITVSKMPFIKNNYVTSI